MLRQKMIFVLKQIHVCEFGTNFCVLKYIQRKGETKKKFPSNQTNYANYILEIHRLIRSIFSQNFEHELQYQLSTLFPVNFDMLRNLLFTHNQDTRYDNRKWNIKFRIVLVHGICLYQLRFNNSIMFAVISRLPISFF